ncbi:MAG: D-mannonate oxidoreductase, partial [Planctomycetota bacterium]
TYMCQNHSTNIRVNAIAPGFFLTDQNRFLLTDEAGDLTDRGKTIIDHTPMGRFGESDELAGTLIWLISDASKFVSGIVVPVDGGFSAFSGV